MAITGMTGMGDTQTEIAKMYQQYLGRKPDQSGLNYYSGIASSGGSMDSILQSIANSPEARSYKSAARPPMPAPEVNQQKARDPQGTFTGLLGSVTSGTKGVKGASAASTDAASTASPGAVTAETVTTPQDSSASTDAAINAIYNQYLGRDAEQAGLEYWAGTLDQGASMDDVLFNIVNSAEGQAYAASLASGADATGSQVEQDFLGTLNSVQASATTTPDTTVDSVSDSVSAEDSGMSREAAEQVVSNLYQSILGRAPLQAGLDYWADSLTSGATVDDVAYNIFMSPEFGGRANSEVNNYFTQLTGAAGDPSQIASYVGEAQSQGKSLDQIYQEIYDSDAAIAFRASQAAAQNNNGQPGSGNVGTGSQGTTQNAVRDTETYEATQAEDSAAAGAEDAQVATRTILPDELVENRINNLLASDNPYIERARTSGLQFANQRGLLNSSIAAQAAEEAAIARAGEIASQDANTYAQAALANQQAQNTAGLQDAQLGTNVSMFNVGEENTTNRFNAQSVNEAGQFNAAAANQAIQNFLQREQVRLLQDDQQAFTAEENEADRVLRQLLQDEQFDFTSSENALDRTLQSALQANQFAFQSGESALDRSQQTALQDDQQAFQTTMQDDQQAFLSIENTRDRATQRLLANKEIAFREWAQTNEQEWRTAQNALELEFRYYNSNAQTATSIMYSTMEGVAQIYADPNLTAAQKQNAITNLLNSANEMPQLLSTIQANVTSIQQTNAATNYDDDGVWIGEGYPNWVVPPSDDQEYAQVETPIVNPNTGQTYMAPNAGWTYLGQTTEEGAGTGPGNAPGNIPSGYTLFVNPQTGQTAPNLYVNANGQFFTWNEETGEMLPINMNPYG